MSVVHFKQSSYEIESLKTRVQEGIILLGGWEKILNEKSSILLKPNLVSSGPASQMHTTHPHIIIAVAQLLLDHGYKVGVADSPGTGSAEHHLNQIGALDPLQNLGVDCFSFTSGRLIKSVDPRYKGLNMAKELDQWEGLINLPKLKSHQQTLFTGATKNLFGCLAGKRKAWAHMQSKDELPSFMKMILTFANEIHPDLHIADGVVALHDGGPIHGKPFELGSLLLSQDFLELDLTFCKLIGLDPKDTPLFKVIEPYATAIPDPKILGDELKKVTGFILPELTSIRFNPLQMLRSLLKALVAKVLK
ncbi:MAG: DUF362 domain-containing protein [SAR324 cluster bacterium]|nr:DUF362 domain-containing protein [SAR324 cluster bacterium]